MFRRILVTGVAGFVGSNVAVMLTEAFHDLVVLGLDNLHRRGSELSLTRLAAAGVGFHHGDIRCTEDLEALPDFDLMIDCAAEPSVHAGVGESPRYVLNNNLQGTLNCIDLAARRGAALLFLSTSRVYPIAALNGLPFSEQPTRFCWDTAASVAGFSSQGIAEEFPLEGPRSFYGASKLAAEMLLQEYVATTGLRALVNRCGIIAGPWQMGKVDQGVVTLWIARHLFGKPLEYIGFGGQGKQVRDMIHVADLFDLLVRQMQSPDLWNGGVYNVGGGRQVSVSLAELTDLCRAATGRVVPVAAQPETHPNDVRIYLTDSRRVSETFAWRPTRTRETIVQDIASWVTSHSEQLQSILG